MSSASYDDGPDIQPLETGEWRYVTEWYRVCGSRSCRDGSSSTTTGLVTSTSSLLSNIVAQSIVEKVEFPIIDNTQLWAQWTEWIRQYSPSTNTPDLPLNEWFMSLFIYFTQRIVCVNRSILLQNHCLVHSVEHRIKEQTLRLEPGQFSIVMQLPPTSWERRRRTSTSRGYEWALRPYI